jgi:virulence-associated protein VagC
MSDQRRVRLFRNGRSQAVRIPVEFELPGDVLILTVRRIQGEAKVISAFWSLDL